MNSKTKWLLVLVAFIALVIIGFAIRGKAGASFTLPVCNADHHYDCATPTPTPKPTENPCKDWKWEEDCITPTPKVTVTPTPTVIVASPSATPVVNTTSSSVAGASGGQGNNPPPVAQCVNNAFVGPVIINFTDKGNGTVNFAWTEITGSIDKYSIVYGYSPDALVYGENNIPGNVWNWDIHDLAVGSHVWARVIAWQNGCSVASNLFDPVVR